MSKYRKKPVVIEAVRVTAADYNPAYYPDPKAWDGCPFSEVPGWLEIALNQGDVHVTHKPGHTDYARWDISTLEGVMTAGPGDYIIRGVKGELYPCKSDIFTATYEAADA